MGPPPPQEEPAPRCGWGGSAPGCGKLSPAACTPAAGLASRPPLYPAHVRTVLRAVAGPLVNESSLRGGGGVRGRASGSPTSGPALLALRSRGTPWGGGFPWDPGARSPGSRSPPGAPPGVTGAAPGLQRPGKRGDGPSGLHTGWGSGREGRAWSERVLHPKEGALSPDASGAGGAQLSGTAGTGRVPAGPGPVLGRAAGQGGRAALSPGGHLRLPGPADAWASGGHARACASGRAGPSPRIWASVAPACPPPPALAPRPATSPLWPAQGPPWAQP